jgi:hypothetical protein
VAFPRVYKEDPPSLGFIRVSQLKPGNSSVCSRFSTEAWAIKGIWFIMVFLWKSGYSAVADRLFFYVSLAILGFFYESLAILGFFYGSLAILGCFCCG